jgi:hypothetical protein
MLQPREFENLALLGEELGVVAATIVVVPLAMDAGEEPAVIAVNAVEDDRAIVAAFVALDEKAAVLAELQFEHRHGILDFS